MSILRFKFNVKLYLGWLIHGMLIVTLSISSPTYGAIDGNVVDKTNVLLQQLKYQTEAFEIIKIAKAVGPIIDETRKSEVGITILNSLRNDLTAMHKLIRQRLTDIERGPMQSEAALERLYRSQSWDDLNFAQAAFAYWRAWIDLELARRNDNKTLKDQTLLRAQKGFRVASMQLFRPGLIYGGWLGIGYVEMEFGNLDRARQIFQRLDEALSTVPDSSIRTAVSLELRLLEIRIGNVRGATRISRNINDNEAKILRAEAFMLLEDSRRTGSPPTGVAHRLKTLIESGRMDQSLLNDMMSYAQEIAGIDVGPWSDLAAAEFRLNHKDYQKAMQKFRVFFKKGIAPQGVDLNYYRYRWSVAAYKAGAYQTAARVLEKLIRKKNLSSEMDKVASKLLYAVYAAREASAGSSGNRKSLRMAAQRFVKKNPTDPDIDTARLVLAQTSSNSNTALKSLEQIQSKSKFDGNIERTAFQFIARDFSDKIAHSKIDMAAILAKQGISAFQKLPKTDKADPLNIAIQLQMRALVDPNPDEVLRSVETLVSKEKTNLDIQQALMWSRLQLYDRQDDWPKIVEFIRSLNAVTISSWQMEFLYPWISKRKDMAQRLEIAKLLHSTVKEQPEMDRRFRKLIIEGLIYTEDINQAYEQAQIYIRDYPNSGDAWRFLARSAELMQKPYEADWAWRVITEKLTPKMVIWWEGMLGRARIRNNSSRSEQTCSLLESLRHNVEYLPVEYKSDYESVMEVNYCQAITLVR